MKTLMIFAAVLLVGEAAKIPQVPIDPVSHQVTVPVPLNVLAPSTDVESDIMPAMVEEVSKDHAHEPDMPVGIQPQVEADTETQTIVEPTTVEPTTVEPTTVEPTTVDPTTVDPTTGEPTTGEPITVESDTETATTVIADTYSVTINSCDLLCTKFEFDPVCATNGLCLHEFPNQCILETYNCKHPSKKFSATKDDRCQMHWLTKCEQSEMI